MFDNLIFIGFNSRVAAVHRDTGEIVWKWKAKKGASYVAVMLDGDRLIVSVVGYTYCLEPATGEQIWYDELDGMGMGVASLASVRGGYAGIEPQAAAQIAAQAAANSTQHSAAARPR